jgi:hypothetical protein
VIRHDSIGVEADYLIFLKTASPAQALLIECAAKIVFSFVYFDVKSKMLQKIKINIKYINK